MIANNFPWPVPEDGFVWEISPWRRRPFRDIGQIVLRPRRDPTDCSLSLPPGFIELYENVNLFEEWLAFKFSPPIDSLEIPQLENLCKVIPRKVLGEGPLGSSSEEELMVYRLRLTYALLVGKLRYYAPMREFPGLFQTFANVEPTLSGILNFANRYGVLCEECSLGIWIEELKGLREAMSIWKFLKKRDEESLLPYFKWEKDDKGVMSVRNVDYGKAPYYTRENFHVSENTPGGLWEKLKSRDVLAAAQIYLMHVANCKFDRHASVRLELNEKTQQPDRVLFPKSLLGAIWLELEQVMFGKGDYKECPICGEWFSVTGRYKHADKLHCTDACRTKASRERQKKRQKAMDMWSGGNGLSYKEIARRLGEDVETVKIWLATQMHGKGLSYKEIARRLGVDVEKVKKWLATHLRDNRVSNEEIARRLGVDVETVEKWLPEKRKKK